ncbi:hypothetical protein Droror1_Dr00000124 [Drosera rotundifolia]
MGTRTEVRGGGGDGTEEEEEVEGEGEGEEREKTRRKKTRRREDREKRGRRRLVADYFDFGFFLLKTEGLVADQRLVVIAMLLKVVGADCYLAFARGWSCWIKGLVPLMCQTFLPKFYRTRLLVFYRGCTDM